MVCCLVIVTFFFSSSSSSPPCVWCVVALGAISAIRLDRPENDISAITLMVDAQYRCPEPGWSLSPSVHLSVRLYPANSMSSLFINRYTFIS